MPALPCCQIRMDIAMTSAASVSMSKRAPNALAIRLRRASQPSTPSRTAMTAVAIDAAAAALGFTGSPIRLAINATIMTRIMVT